MLMSEAIDEFDSITTLGGARPRFANAASTDRRAMTLGFGNIQDSSARSVNCRLAAEKIGWLSRATTCRLSENSGCWSNSGSSEC
jgi:hypothetical protein